MTVFMSRRHAYQAKLRHHFPGRHLVAWALGYSFHLARQNSSVLTAGGGMPYPKRIVWAALLAMVTLFTVAIWTYPL